MKVWTPNNLQFIKDIKCVLKCFPTKKTSGADDFTLMKSLKVVQISTHSTHTLQKKRKKNAADLLDKVCIAQIPYLEKTVKESKP